MKVAPNSGGRIKAALIPQERLNRRGFTAPFPGIRPLLTITHRHPGLLSRRPNRRYGLLRAYFKGLKPSHIRCLNATAIDACKTEMSESIFEPNFKSALSQGTTSVVP